MTKDSFTAPATIRKVQQREEYVLSKQNDFHLLKLAKQFVWQMRGKSHIVFVLLYFYCFMCLLLPDSLITLVHLVLVVTSLH